MDNSQDLHLSSLYCTTYHPIGKKGGDSPHSAMYPPGEYLVLCSIMPTLKKAPCEYGVPSGVQVFYSCIPLKMTDLAEYPSDHSQVSAHVPHFKESM